MNHDWLKRNRTWQTTYELGLYQCLEGRSLSYRNLLASLSVILMDHVVSAAFSRQSGPSGRWVFVPYDQLNDKIGPLHEFRNSALESYSLRQTGNRKGDAIANRSWCLLSNQRHFALDKPHSVSEWNISSAKVIW